MRIVFAVGLVEGFLDNMQEIGVKDVLVSYWEAKEDKSQFIERIATGGDFVPANARPAWANNQYIGFRSLALIRRAAAYEEAGGLCE